MASYKKINNKWSVVFDTPSDDDKRKQKRLSGYLTRREAELAYVAFVGENKTIKPEGQYPFEVVFDRYLAFQENRIKESSYLDTMQNSRHYLSYFSGVDIPKIKAADIIDWQIILNSKGYKYKYKDKILGYLKNFFVYCIEIEEIIKDNPIKKQIKFSDNEEKKEMLFYEPEEYAQFRTAISECEKVKDERKLKDLCLFDSLYFAGMRKGELMALKWTDFYNNGFNISKTYSRKTVDGKWKITAPKTKNSNRHTSLPAFLVDNLNKYKTSIKANDTDYVFGDILPTNEKYLDNSRDKYVKAANLKRIRIHDFRHSHVSYLISCNIDVLTIAKRVGDTIETILKTYAHLLQRNQQEVLDKLNDVALLFDTSSD